MFQWVQEKLNSLNLLYFLLCPNKSCPVFIFRLGAVHPISNISLPVRYLQLAEVPVAIPSGENIHVAVIDNRRRQRIVLNVIDWPLPLIFPFSWRLSSNAAPTEEH